MSIAYIFQLFVRSRLRAAWQKRNLLLFVAFFSTVYVLCTLLKDFPNDMHRMNSSDFKVLQMANNWMHPKNMTQIWKQMDRLISPAGLYPSNININPFKEAIRSAKIVKADMFQKQVSYKWILTLEGGQQILFKPILLPRDHKAKMCDSDCEHPEYEIAAFTMNRLLGFNNMPIAVGRKLSWYRDIAPVASNTLLESVNQTSAGDLCFYWQCPKLENMSYFCFNKGVVYGSAQYWVNRGIETFYNKNRWPYHDFHFFSDTKEFFHYLQGDDRYCKKFRSEPPYTEDRWFLHIIDMAVLDYLTNNLDQRHTYLVDNSSQPFANVMIDFGQAFCRAFSGAQLLAAPIYQCCQIRRSTYEALLHLKDTLPEKFEWETEDDPIYPILQPGDFQDMHKRLRELLSLLDFCLVHKGFKNVLFD
ncbi:hypothetical protein CHS0354_032428 [Potamilus streckersoni]|uniref:FAM20 C-terminal domain-containing protein n=1 Tax=Potamilus streckersoni TaxID=2493646 RepID=A0AAE0VZI9_9BIVA|nr:hypothetical protein CHS0354_032428 [Potamilus streckersoni]